MNAPLTIFAEIVPKPNHFIEARNAILGIIPMTVNEPGCRLFELFENREDGRLYLFEKWSAQEALDHHYAQPYTKDVFAAYEDWLLEPPKIRKMVSVEKTVED